MPLDLLSLRQNAIITISRFLDDRSFLRLREMSKVAEKIVENPEITCTRRKTVSLFGVKRSVSLNTEIFVYADSYKDYLLLRSSIFYVKEKLKIEIYEEDEVESKMFWIELFPFELEEFFEHLKPLIRGTEFTQIKIEHDEPKAFELCSDLFENNTITDVVIDQKNLRTDIIPVRSLIQKLTPDHIQLNYKQFKLEAGSINFVLELADLVKSMSICEQRNRNNQKLSVVLLRGNGQALVVQAVSTHYWRIAIAHHTYNLRSAITAPDRLGFPTPTTNVRQRNLQRVETGLRRSVKSLRELAGFSGRKASDRISRLVERRFEKVLSREPSRESLEDFSVEKADETAILNKDSVERTPTSRIFKERLSRFGSFLRPKSAVSSESESRLSTSCIAPIPTPPPPQRPSRRRDFEEHTTVPESLEDIDPFFSPIQWNSPAIEYSKVSFDLGVEKLERSKVKGERSPIETGVLGERSPADSTQYLTANYSEANLNARVEASAKRLERAIEQGKEIAKDRGEFEEGKKRRAGLFAKPRFPSLLTSTPKPVKQIQFEPATCRTKSPLRMAELWRELDPLVVSQIPSFSGEGGQQFLDYLDVFHRWCKSFGLSAVKQFKLLPLKLVPGSRAERYYNEIEKNPDIINIESLQQKLLEKLCTKESMMRAKFGMHVPMKETESLAEYASRVRRDHLAAYPDLKEDALSRMMSDCFCAGTPQSIRWKLIKESPRTLNAALESAERHLTFLEISKGGGIEEINDKLDKITSALLKARLEEPMPSATVNYVGRGFSDFRGRYNQTGWNESRGYQNRRGYDNQRREAVICFNCGESGHFARDCQEAHDAQEEFSNEVVTRRNSRHGHGGFPRNKSQERGGNFERNQSRERRDYNNKEFGDDGDVRRSGRFSQPFVNTLMLTVCLFSLFMPAEAETFYSCKSSETAALLFSPDDTNLPCKADFDNLITSFTRAVVYKGDGLRPPIPVFACSEIETTTCITGYGRIFNLTMNSTSVERPIDTELCAKIEKGKFSEFGTLFESKDGIWKTEISELPDLPYYGTKCSVMKSHLLQYGTAYELRKGIPVSTVGQIFGCPFEKGFCVNENRTIIWTVPEESNNCLEVIGQHEVIVNERIILIPKLEKMLIPLSHEMDRDECSKRNLLKLSEYFYLSFSDFSEATSLYDLVGKRRMKRFEKVETEPFMVPRPTVASVVPTTTVRWNASHFTRAPERNPMVVMENELSRNDINRVFLEMCEERKQKRRIERMEMQINPTKAIQRVLGRFDIRADKISNSIFSIFLCEAVFPTSIKEHRGTLTGKGYNCFTYLPIRVNETELYVDEETFHVHDSSPVTSCHRIEGKQKRTEIVHRMRITRAQQTQVISLANATNGNTIPVLGIGVGNLEDFKKVSTSLWDRVTTSVVDLKNRGMEAAKQGSAMVVNFGLEAKEKVASFVSSWMRFVRNLFFVVLGCVITGGILFILFKYWLWKELTSCGLSVFGRSILKRSVSEPRVNYILRRRASSEGLNPQARYSRFIEHRDEQQEMELVTYVNHRSARKPMIHLVLGCVCLMGMSLLPGAEAAESIGQVTQTESIVVSSGVMVPLTLISCGVFWWCSYCKSCSEIIISQVSRQFPAIIREDDKKKKVYLKRYYERKLEEVGQKKSSSEDEWSDEL